MQAMIDGLVLAWKKNSEYAERLVSDLSAEQMIAQPAPNGKAPANHPAWVFSHLNVYLPIIESLIAGKEFADPKAHQFGMDSKPEADGSIYQPKEKLIETFVSAHDSITKQLENAPPEIFENEVKLERWKSSFPKAGFALPYLMLLHENQHLGQVSAWRRIQGMPSV